MTKLDTDYGTKETVAHARTRGRPRAVDKQPLRQSVQTPIRQETAIAHGRTRKRKGSIDQFEVPQNLVPDGWTYEWKAKEVIGMPQTAHMVGLFENGWTTVPSERHEGYFMAPGHRGEISRGGLVLMERPVELTAEARAEERAATMGLVNAQKQQLGLSLPDSFDGNHPGVRPRVNVSYERGSSQAPHQIANE